jgi:hypothetical protein
MNLIASFLAAIIALVQVYWRHLVAFPDLPVVVCANDLLWRDLAILMSGCQSTSGWSGLQRSSPAERWLCKSIPVASALQCRGRRATDRRHWHGARISPFCGFDCSVARHISIAAEIVTMK